MSRRDFEDAPVANSLVPAASTVVVGDGGRALLQWRSGNGTGGCPGAAGRGVGDR
ncbi:hypothetical protein WEB32_10680 [Streptomyces netropsis]|uniref:Uncharacterized protein n=1 Tax=Streptomyces netropsis TaxID=55404 RepID=A0A7W7PCX8_STRNE|nr:hypothetical protein [Streptomyces netropsis]MBB4884493.1 hypothetical protein [Streptomyces netropsis]GGR03283.1 hypothetical protein GCM10010219_04180 [Streptomyces netropsis]